MIDRRGDSLAPYSEITHSPLTQEASFKKVGELAAAERNRLTIFKWRYRLINDDNFTVPQAKRLIFMRWLYFQGRLTEG